ncbi:MAG TPA: Holliday junction resolvase RuvX [Anaerolineales bacterium]|jgi:putative Holliday junction resolvase
MKILAVDPGSKRIGLAISDPTGTIASPLRAIDHVSRPVDAAAIVKVAAENNVGKVVVGQSLDEHGAPTFEGRRAARLAGAIRSLTEIPVELWDESFSTHDARAARIAMGTSRRRRSGHMDELAATVILQSYLDAHRKAP